MSDKLLEHGEKIAKLETKVDLLYHAVNELKQQNNRIEEKLDTHMAHIASLQSRVAGIAFVVGAIVSGITSLLFKLIGFKVGES
ncbi:hypothetical protein Hydth_0565 [Hydrogenobacter thermophilus TK-6]|uniref:Uncharacterized protein n=1 Tax=Hydrogenobacter thermophilus (strain DSM 6534 / IAM 12695 / TK-6) TaxID=608538 RepID=D3DGS6_HYDTT|nr:hypothetical protein [Hydrogenobacter thermophilus]ADO44964.1 hypothetical protein Hydth_0565 [Hydrogenobacter thermophilus TK-6]BAI69028.1 hypothetical protein HTH_0566 [Hydrogenobacter thermophilus TK-6]